VNAEGLGLFDGAKLRAAVKASDYTVVALAEQAEISRETLFACMAGNAVPRTDLLTRLCLIMSGGKPQTARRMYVDISGMAQPRRPS
jgi:hypothetical protein